MKRAAAIAAACLLIAASLVLIFIFIIYPGLNNNLPGDNGITGIVTLGPLRPVVREGDTEPNEKPYPDAVILIKDANGDKIIKQIKSDQNGEFTVALFPNTYTLEPQTPGGSILPRASPQTVEVKQGQYTEVKIEYDTGIR
jgi:hypothetical protein